MSKSIQITDGNEAVYPSGVYGKGQLVDCSWWELPCRLYDNNKIIVCLPVTKSDDVTGYTATSNTTISAWNPDGTAVYTAVTPSGFNASDAVYSLGVRLVITMPISHGKLSQMGWLNMRDTKITLT